MNVGLYSQSFKSVTKLATIKELSVTGRHHECLQACQEAIMQAPEDVLDKYAGKSLLALGQIEQARKLLLKAQQLNQSDHETAKDIGECYLQLQDTNNARKWYVTSLSINNKYLPAINNIANLESKSGNHKNAIEFFKKAISADPDVLNAMLFSASSAIALGQADQEIAFALSVLEINPNKLKANELLDISCQSNGDQEKAIEYYQKEISCNSKVLSSVTT